MRSEGTAGGHRSITKGSPAAKFVAWVEHRTYSGALVAAKGQPVLYVTERCVLRLRPQGLELIEIAPGVDLERDILARMDFRPLMERPPRIMDERLFRPEAMGIRNELLGVAIEERLIYNAQEDLFFVNCERLAIHTSADIESARAAITARLAPLGHKVHAIVNHINRLDGPGLLSIILQCQRWHARRIDRPESPTRVVACRSRSAWRWSQSPPASCRPTAHIRQGFIHESLHIRVGQVRLSGNQRLAAALFRKAWAARIRHPDLHRAKSFHTQGIAMLLNTGVQGKSCHRKSPVLSSRQTV